MLIGSAARPQQRHQADRLVGRRRPVADGQQQRQRDGEARNAAQQPFELQPLLAARTAIAAHLPAEPEDPAGEQHREEPRLQPAPPGRRPGGMGEGREVPGRIDVTAVHDEDHGGDRVGTADPHRADRVDRPRRQAQAIGRQAAVGEELHGEAAEQDRGRPRQLQQHGGRAERPAAVMCPVVGDQVVRGVRVEQEAESDAEQDPAHGMAWPAAGDDDSDDTARRHERDIRKRPGDALVGRVCQHGRGGRERQDEDAERCRQGRQDRRHAACRRVQSVDRFRVHGVARL